MSKISLSINPTYLCNFRCNFCYLTEEQLSSKNKLDLKKLENLLIELKDNSFEIDHVDLYGGEISLLNEEYLNSLDTLLEKYDNPTINVVTNLSKINNYFLKEHVDLSVSFDFDVREKSDLVIQNILKIKKNISILMLASKDLIKKNVDDMINFFNHIENIKSVEIKPYSSNQANNLNVLDIEFENFVKKWITSKINKNFNFKNYGNIAQSINKTNNSFSDDHIYITPNGKLAVLEFDTNNHEFFLELDSVSDYLNWTNKEKLKVKNNNFCKNCEFLGNCLTEHYREVLSLENSCNGYINLLKWAKDRFQ
jgi:sulfatase maturation enzyme AslB (radical SAM superfamily)